MKKTLDFEVNDFPISGSITTGLLTLQLNFSSEKYVKEMEQLCLHSLIQWFNIEKVAKKVHRSRFRMCASCEIVQVLLVVLCFTVCSLY